ncbi:MAG: 30S ribosomal protein S4 [Candidatus Aenigmatarchaeota archaeon]|nr:30S ribosomal protein S4 [Candidatus Aenigmarchaeota archaeon]
MRRQHKFYETPRKPWDKLRIEQENKLMKEYGLKRKREIWRAEAILRNFRRQARELAGMPGESTRKEILIGKLNRLGILPTNATLDDILALEINNILDRRLQTLVFKKGLAKTPKQARQFIVHGHISVNGRIVKWPSFLVPTELENKISFSKKKEQILTKIVKGEI